MARLICNAVLSNYVEVALETPTQRGNLLTYPRLFLKTCPPFMITKKFL
jgi:hypothetical protein